METNKFTVATSISLYTVISNILFKEENGQNVERELPFNVKFKLQRAGAIFEKDYLTYNSERDDLIKQYGEEKDGNYVVKDENKEKFTDECKELLKREVEHSVIKFKPEDIEYFSIPGLPAREMELFMMCMVDDPEYKSEVVGK